MLTKTEIRQALSSQGIKVTATNLAKQAKAMGFGAQDAYDNDQAQDLINHFAGAKAGPKTAQKAADTNTLARVMETSEGAIANRFDSQIEMIRGELTAARQVRDRLADQASDAIVTLFQETKPLIYLMASEKLAAAQTQTEFSLASLMDEVLVLSFDMSAPALSGESYAGLLTSTAPPY